ncbi:MAG: hypothetical protein VCD00_13120 [Candidatus Hydrogenedentota bacterium]
MIAGRLKEILVTAWRKWSAIQDSEDETWSETLGDHSTTAVQTGMEEPCSKPLSSESIPTLDSLVAERNREREKLLPKKHEESPE